MSQSYQNKRLFESKVVKLGHCNVNFFIFSDDDFKMGNIFVSPMENTRLAQQEFQAEMQQVKELIEAFTHISKSSTISQAIT